jgi:hypothetical protein
MQSFHIPVLPLGWICPFTDYIGLCVNTVVDSLLAI